MDTASYFSSANGVWVDLSAGTANLGQAGGDTLIFIENLLGSGNGNERLTGDSGGNRLNGFVGEDWLNGMSSDDILSMGTADGGFMIG